MSVKEIVKKYLENNGYDGLYNEICGCQNSDLMPCCCEGIEDCEAGYKIPCIPETCPANGDCDWHIGPRQGTEQ